MPKHEPLAVPPPLATERLILRQLVEDDWRASLLHRSDPEVSRYTGPPLDAEETRELIRERFEWSGENGKWLALAIVVRDDHDVEHAGEVIGEGAVRILDRDHLQAEIGYRLRRDVQGQGYGRESAEGMLWLAFEHFRMHRVVAICDVRNTASYRLMERLGMQREGVLRDGFLREGEWCNNYLYSILEHEWREDRTD